MDTFQILSLFLAALGAGLGAAASNFFIARQAQKEREEDRRKERIKFLISQQQLILNQLHRNDRSLSETVMREIIAISMTINDPELNTLCEMWHTDIQAYSEQMRPSKMPHNPDFITHSFVYDLLSRIGAIIQETSLIK